MRRRGLHLGVRLGIATLMCVASGCAAAPAAPNASALTATVAAPTPPQGATASPAASAVPPQPTAPGSSPTAPAGASPSSQIVPSAPASLADPICDPYLTAAEVASVSGTVAFIQGSERPGPENTQAIDLLCIYTLASRATVRFQVFHELSGTTTNGGSVYTDATAVLNVKEHGGKPVSGLGMIAYSIEVNGTAELAWQISKVGKKTIADDLDGPVLADLLAIAKLVRNPG